MIKDNNLEKSWNISDENTDSEMKPENTLSAWQ